MTISQANYKPLANRARPKNISDYIGQEHLLGKGKALNCILKSKIIPSMILFGPPGTGKTSLAYLLARESSCEIEELSAVNTGVKEIRLIIKKATINKSEKKISTILFLDEIHRYSKSQQDILLPYIESGLLILIGATTENPFFSINKALLSRVTIFKLKSLSYKNIRELLIGVCKNDIVYQYENINITDDAIKLIYNLSGGDCRIALNLLERSISSHDKSKLIRISHKSVEQIMGEPSFEFDHHGDHFYDQLSAFHKSIRGSSADGAMFWLIKMINSGCSPQVITRRMLCIASEDIGNADPRALSVALNAWDAFDKLGLPEGMLALSQATIYLAVAPKSNSVYKAYKQVLKKFDINKNKTVPEHLKNLKTTDTKHRYKYPHDYEHAYVKQQYFPNGLEEQYYYPSNRGLEYKIKQKIDFLNSI